MGSKGAGAEMSIAPGKEVRKEGSSCGVGMGWTSRRNLFSDLIRPLRGST